MGLKILSKNGLKCYIAIRIRKRKFSVPAFANCVNRADYFTSSGSPIKTTLLEATGLEDPVTGGGIEVAKAIVLPARTV